MISPPRHDGTTLTESCQASLKWALKLAKVVGGLTRLLNMLELSAEDKDTAKEATQRLDCAPNKPRIAPITRIRKKGPDDRRNTLSESER